MADLTRDDVDTLVTFAKHNQNVLGYGEPSPTTKRFVAEGLIDVETVGEHWKAKLTKAGKRFIDNATR